MGISVCFHIHVHVHMIINNIYDVIIYPMPQVTVINENNFKSNT